MAGEGLAAYATRDDLQQYQPNALGLFALELRFGIDDPFELVESITDGEKDKKCDLFHIDEPLRTAVILQAYEARSPKDYPPVNKASDLHAAVSWLINPSSAGALNPRMQSAAADLRAAIEDGDIDTIEIWFTHNCPDNKDVDDELAQVAKTAKALLDSTHGDVAVGIACVPLQVGSDRLDTWLARRSEQILINEMIEVPSTGHLSEEGPNWRAALTSVPGKWLKDLHDTHGPGLLFAGNVRDFLGARPSRSRINHGIATTARERPADFWAFNNGVTALTKEFVENNDGRLIVRGITIVNGAQTTGAISSIELDDALRVPIRFVACSDDDLIQSIKRATNTQNEIP